MTINHSSPTIRQQRMPGGLTRLDVLIDGQSVSHLVVVPMTIRVGVATVRAAGISDVWTEQAYRQQGHARRLIEATIWFMRSSPAALSLLYGIDAFYPKFGYTTVGPMYHLRIADMTNPLALPAGWHIRPLRHADLPAVKALYKLNTAGAVGAMVRLPRSWVWSQLTQAAQPDSGDECRVVADEREQPVAYAWRGAHLGYVLDFERYGPDTLVLAEVMAAHATAADAILAACCQWGTEESARRPQPLRWVYTSLPPWSMVATAAAYHGNWLDTQSFRSGGFMARALRPQRLLAAVRPELEQRLRNTRISFNGMLRLRTEEGAATLVITGDKLVVQSDHRASKDALTEIDLPHTTLIRLALGAFPPTDLLARLPVPPDDPTTELIAALFPRRDIHLYLPDRP